MRTLVTGWFSFEGMNVTAGDVLARDVACRWLAEAGIAFDVASHGAAGPGIDWRQTDPSRYAQVLFVCGPFRDNAITAEFLHHFRGFRGFRGVRIIGLNLSMIQPLETWNPFDVLLERDSSRQTRPDLVFAAESAHVPVVGLLLVHPQPQYGKRAMHDQVHRTIRGFLAGQDAAVVPIDTCLEDNRGGLRNAAQIESLIARMDLVVTTRLHGTVLAIRNGVPAIAVDPIAGGAKILAQARAIDWPMVFTADALTPADLERACAYCRTPEARSRALASRERAQVQLQQVREQFLAAVMCPQESC